MKVSFYLHSQPDSDGKRLIMLRYSHSGLEEAAPWREVLKNEKGVSFSVHPHNWIKNKRELDAGIKKRIYTNQDRTARVRTKAPPHEVISPDLINRIIDKKEEAIYHAVKKIIEEGRDPVPNLVKAALEIPERKRKYWDVFEEFYKWKSTQIKKISLITYDQFKRRCQEFEKEYGRLTFSKMDGKFWGEMYAYFEGEINDRTIKTSLLTPLKAFLGYAFDNGYLSTLDFKKWSLKTGMAQHIALSIQDVNELYALPENAYIDKLLFHIWTGLRFDEYTNILKIQGGILYFQKGKTAKGRDAVYPVKLIPPAIKIYQKYNGDLPQYSNPVFNRNIKKILKTNTHFQRDVIVNGRMMPIWAAISSHTGRRTLATLMSKAGVNYIDISKTVGHSLKGNITLHYDKSGHEAAFRAMDKFWISIADQVFI